MTSVIGSDNVMRHTDIHIYITVQNEFLMLQGGSLLQAAWFSHCHGFPIMLLIAFDKHAKLFNISFVLEWTSVLSC